MAKVDSPLFCVEAWGHYGRALTYTRTGAGPRAQHWSAPGGAPSAKQKEERNQIKLWFDLKRRTPTEFPNAMHIWKNSYYQKDKKLTEAARFLKTNKIITSMLNPDVWEAEFEVTRFAKNKIIVTRQTITGGRNQIFVGGTASWEYGDDGVSLVLAYYEDGEVVDYTQLPFNAEIETPRAWDYARIRVRDVHSQKWQMLPLVFDSNYQEIEGA